MNADKRTRETIALEELKNETDESSFMCCTKQAIKNAINSIIDFQDDMFKGLEPIHIDIEVDVKQAYDVLDCVVYYFRKNNTLVNGDINGHEIKPDTELHFIKPDTELHFEEFINSFPRGDNPEITYRQFKEYMRIIHSFFDKFL